MTMNKSANGYFQPENIPTDVGKLNFEFNENEFKNRRRSVGKLNNPWESGVQNKPAQNKPKSRRQSRVLLPLTFI